jgi:Sigma-70 factor, region 1.2
MDQHQKAVKAYMSEIGNYGLVTPLQEVELATLIAEGSDAAREMLTHGNLRLVVKIANEYRHLGVPMSDLIAEGNVGLMRAVLKFRGGQIQLLRRLVDQTGDPPLRRQSRPHRPSADPIAVALPPDPRSRRLDRKQNRPRRQQP